MNKLRIISCCILVFALTLSLLCWGYIFLTFPVVFLMSFDNADLNLLNFIKNIAAVLSVLIFYQGKIISVMISFIGAFLFYKKRYGISIVFSFLAIISVAGFYQYHAFQDQKKHQTNLDDFKIREEKARITEPQAPFYIPKKDFSFLGYEQESRRVTDNDLVQFQFKKKGDTTKKPSRLHIRQSLTKNTSEYYKEKPSDLRVEGKFIETFEYNGFYGYIYKFPHEKTSSFYGNFNDPDEESYGLYWADDNTIFEVMLMGFLDNKNDIRVAEQLRQILFQFEKAK